MKKNFKYAILSAIALVGAVSLTSCSSSDDVVENPDYNPVDNTVKTQFALSISKAGATNPATTRQTGTIVQIAQNQGAFRGMSKMSLIPFGSAPGASSSALGPVIGPLTMDPLAASFDNDDNNAVVYTNITVPTNTTHFLFYGQATEAEGTNNFDNGALTVSGLYGATEGTYSFLNPSAITFTPVQIYDESKTTQIAVGTNLIALLNSLLTATDGAAEPKTWSQYTTNPLLNDLYNKYIRLTTGSSYSVAAMLVDLYASLEGLAGTAAGSDGQAMAEALRTAIAAGFTGDVTENNITYAGYPGNLGMPDGAAKLTFATATGFSLAASNTGNYPASTITVTSYTDYVYPANLQYFVSSDIKTSAQQQSPNFDGKTSWDACTALYTAGNKVQSTTKSVALVNEIQYGVGNLNIIINKLKYDGMAATPIATYYDRNAEVIDVSSETPFVLTGVLVGGQGQVGWNFIPVAAGAKTIYDNVISAPSLKTTDETEAVAGANNYTLGLETLASDVDATNCKIPFALELRNDTGKDFMGADGLIPAGGKFYLAGTLDPASVTVVNTQKSVFKQDYITTATITILEGTPEDKYPEGDPDGIYDYATGGFANATNGVPDLRTPQSEVCFSVNLTWTPGLNFSVDL